MSQTSGKESIRTNRPFSEHFVKNHGTYLEPKKPFSVCFDSSSRGTCSVARSTHVWAGKTKLQHATQKTDSMQFLDLFCFKIYVPNKDLSTLHLYTWLIILILILINTAAKALYSVPLSEKIYRYIKYTPLNIPITRIIIQCSHVEDM